MSDGEDLLDELFPVDEQEDSLMMKVIAAATKPYNHDKMKRSIDTVSGRIGTPTISFMEVLIVVLVCIYLPIVLSIVALFSTISGTAAIIVLVFFAIFLLLAYIYVRNYMDSLNDYVDHIKTEGFAAAEDGLDNYLSTDK